MTANCFWVVACFSMLCCNAWLNGQHPSLLKADHYLSLAGRDRPGGVLIDVIGLMAITEEMQRNLRASGLELKQLRKLRCLECLPELHKMSPMWFLNVSCTLIEQQVQFGARDAAAVQAGHGGRSDDAGAEKHPGPGLEACASVVSQYIQ